jgi:hypothetical protein
MGRLKWQETEKEISKEKTTNDRGYKQQIRIPKALILLKR